jgi:hypothetical protein
MNMSLGGDVGVDTGSSPNGDSFVPSSGGAIASNQETTDVNAKAVQDVTGSEVKSSIAQYYCMLTDKMYADRDLDIVEQIETEYCFCEGMARLSL